MPDEPIRDVDPQQPGTTLNEQSSTAQSSGQAEPFRYGPDAGVLAGKTAEEAAAFNNELASQAQQLYQQNLQMQQQMQQIAQQQQIQAQTQAASASVDPDEMLTDPQAFAQKFEQAIMTKVGAGLQQAAQPLLAQNAQAARYMSAQDNGDVFQRWGHEVDRVLSNIPLENRSKEMYDQAAKIVKSNHIDELAQERAERLMASGTGLARSSHDPGYISDGGDQSVWDKFQESERGRYLVEKYGKSTVARNAKAAGYSLNEYADIVSKNKARQDPSSPNVWRTELVKE